MTLSETAYAKLNLALHVRSRGADGYHAIETVFAFAEDGDVLEGELADVLTLEVTGEFARAIDGGNLVLAAAERLRAAFGVTAGARLRLDKGLPVAAGIGGGSADAAAALRLLTQLWGIDQQAPTSAQPPVHAERSRGTSFERSREASTSLGMDGSGSTPDTLALADCRIAEIARELGADVPACLASASAFGTGRGDDLTSVTTGWEGCPVLLVNPRVPLATRPVFAGWDGVDRGPLDPADPARGRNDLEPPARALVPEVGDVLARLAAQPGVTMARMSGSGATCFALFEDTATRDRAAAAMDNPWWTLVSRVREA